MTTQNLTLVVDEEVLRGARKYALERQTSVNRLVRDYLASLSNVEVERRLAREYWRNGPRPGKIAPITWKREDLYER